MPLARIPALKEGAVHGDPALPAAIYTLHANQAGCFVLTIGITNLNCPMSTPAISY